MLRAMLANAPAAGLLAALAIAPQAVAQDRVHGNLIQFSANGAWSWFEDERCIVDPLRGRILVSSVADGSGVNGPTRDGNTELAWLDLSSGTFGSFVLNANLEDDDHNSAALLVRPDGRYLTMYGMHGNGPSSEIRKSRWRISTDPGNAASWQPEGSYSHPVFMSYSNLFHLEDTGRTYNFVRATNFDPNVMVSVDLGATWSGGGKLVTYGGSSARPYAKYASDNRRRIDVLTTETHPRNLNTSIYHGYLEGDQLFDSSGNLLDANVLDASGVSPTQLTTVFAANTQSASVPMRRCWTIDLHTGADGTVRALFQARANGSNQDHRLFLAQHDGTTWSWHEVCRLGGYLYAQEDDYTGLAALHPDRPDTLFVSTRIDPQTGTALTHYEIFRGTTGDGGSTWSWSAITEDSTCDNLRPIVPAWDEQRTAVLWLRGTYSTYTNYDLAVVGIVDAPELSLPPGATYYDATPQNTTLANSLPANPTGPSPGQGAADDRWHVRTGFGNGGSVLTASEGTAENAPTLRTNISGLPFGRLYDVYVTFWSNPAQGWRVRAGLTPYALRTFTRQGAAAADSAHFQNPVVTTTSGGSEILYSIWIGRTTANLLGQVWVYIDDEDVSQTGSRRTWYDGVALREVVDPATFTTTGSGCNGPQQLVTSGPPQLGATVQTGIIAAPANSFTALQLGHGDLTPMSLAAIGFPNCTLFVDSITSTSLGIANSQGISPTVLLSIPNNPNLHGLRFALQGWCLTLANLHMTPAQVWMPGS